MNNNKNTVELLGWYGGDKTHCLSAWTSTFTELGIELPVNIENRIDTLFEYIAKYKKKTPEELLNMLAVSNHGTPFEKSSLHFLVNTEIATHIHLIKHRIAVSVNAESARYKELQEDKYYMPEDWGCIENSNFCENMSEIVGDYSMSPVDGYRKWLEILDWYTISGNKLYHQCVKDLTPILGRKRAKESARFFKTYNSQITSDVMFNFRSFIHFQQLRNSEHAQKEVRELAQKMLELVKNIPGDPFKYSLSAFNY